MSDGISDMYREATEDEANGLFFRELSKCLETVLGESVSDELVASALASQEARIIMGNFNRLVGGDKKGNQKSIKECRKILGRYLDKLNYGDEKEWVLLLARALHYLHEGEAALNSLIKKSPFSGKQIVLIGRGNGRINVGAGLGDLLWAAAGKGGVDYAGLAIMEIKDLKIHPLPKKGKNDVYIY